jgi:hypothetical protein
LHVAMDVVKITRNVGLELLALPLHMLHVLQPLGVSCFKSFKQKSIKGSLGKVGVYSLRKRHYLKRTSKVVSIPLGFFLSTATP